MIGIYKILSPTNKIYIGQSWDISLRKSKYQSNDCIGQTKLYNSLIKYGWNNHKFEIIHELPEDVTQEVLDNYEILYINQYKDCGFEMLNIRGGGYGGKHSKSSKDKISKSLINKPKPQGFGELISFKLKGRIISEETKEKIKKSNTGKKRTEEQKNKLRKPLSEEHKQKLRGIRKPLTKQHKLNLSNALKGKGTGKQSQNSINKRILKLNKPISQYDIQGNFIKEWFSKTEAENKLKCFHIRCVVNKPNKTAGGYLWKYSNKIKDIYQ